MNKEKVLEALIKSLKDNNSSVRAVAAESLGKIGDKRAYNCLKEAMNDENKEVRNKAYKALKDLGYIKRNENVPEWNEYDPSLENANNEQKAYYDKWSKELNNNNFLDIDGNLSYVFVFLYSIIEKFIENRDINYFLENFNKIEKGYGNYEKINESLLCWKSDAYCFVGNYEKALEVLKEKGLQSFQVTRFAELISNEKSNFISGNDLINIVGTSNFTDFGKKHTNEIAKIGTLFLKDFYEENGRNLVQFFLKNFDLKNLTEEDFDKLKQFFPNNKQFLKYKSNYYSRKALGTHHLQLIDDCSHGLFSGVPVNIDPKYIQMKHTTVPPIIMEAMKNEIKRILYECENTVREEMDLPKIGEGWISETHLYYKIKEAFPKEVIIHHGRPSWLERQHLDVYFAIKNIAIEYQGEQHQNPIEYFGGEKAFKHRKKLDKQKMDRCNDNNCKLIFVYPNYDFNKIKEQITKILNDKIIID